MFNLYQIITGAQGGQAVDNLAQQFGLSSAQADGAIKALVPALSTAFMTKMAHPGGFSEIAGALSDDQHKQAYADPSVAQDPTTQQKGGDLAGSIFGNNAIVQQVLQQASQYTGVPVATLEQMLPVLISIVVGGVSTAMHNQGLGGMLGQLANNGLGGLFGGGAAAPGQVAGGGFGGIFESILSSVLGGTQAASPQQPTPQAGQAPQDGQPPQAVPTGMPPAFQAGMDALSKMFQPGVQPHPAMGGDLGAQISSILSGKG